MNCRDLERRLFEWDSKTELPQAAGEHLTGCSGCRGLVELLTKQGTSDGNLSPALDALASRLASDLRPVRPLLSPGFFLAAFWGMCALIGAFGVYLEGTSGLTAMSSLQSVPVLCALGACSAMVAWSLVRQMVPGSRHVFRPEVLPGAVIGSLLLLAIAIFRLQNQPPFWPRAWFCIHMGLSFASLAGLPFWLLLRRGAVLSPGTTGAAAGLLAGLAGMTVVEIHCPNLDIRHVLVSHVGIAALGALLGYLTGVAGETMVRSGKSASGKQQR